MRDSKVIPDRPNPPRLVNDFANMMTAGEQDQLERELLDFSRETSNEITIVTIDSLGDYDVSDYANQNWAKHGGVSRPQRQEQWGSSDRFIERP